MESSRYSGRSRSRDRLDAERRNGSKYRSKRSRSRSVERSNRDDRGNRPFRRSPSRSPLKYKRSYSPSPNRNTSGYRKDKEHFDMKRRDTGNRDQRDGERGRSGYTDRSDSTRTREEYRPKSNESDAKRPVRESVDDMKRVRYDENLPQVGNVTKNTKDEPLSATVKREEGKVVVPAARDGADVPNAKESADGKRDGFKSPSYDEDELAEFENFIEFGMSAEERQQREAEKLAADRRRRAEAIASRYTQQQPSSPRTAAAGEVVVPVVTLKRSIDVSQEGETTERPAAAAATTTSAVPDEGHSNMFILDDLPVDNSYPQVVDTNIPAVSQDTFRRVMSLENLALEDAGHHASVLVGTAPQVSSAEMEAALLATERSAVEAEERANKQKTFAFDMFSASPSGIAAPTLTSAAAAAAKGGPLLARPATGADHGDDHTNWDDGEGYYRARIGEVLGDRFQTLGVVGKGVFSTVLKCYDLKTGNGTNVVAVKLIRNNDTMRKAAERERAILLSIMEKDPENKRFCVRLLSHMDFKGHVAMVFEFQTMNLRETLKKFGKDVGINIGAVRMYGRQLMVALRFLMELKVVHADIKLDNILCSGDLKTVKLCDFGSAFHDDDADNVPTPYLVSRFYRAPEIIMGFQYDRAIDLWSVCVCLYELFTGHVMFPGRTNNEMLRLMMQVKGRMPNKVVKAHLRAYEALSLEAHFDEDCRFKQYEADPMTGKTVLRLMDVSQPTRDLTTVLRGSKAGADDIRMVTLLTDLLEKGLALEASKRLPISEALKHPFFTSQQNTTAVVGQRQQS